MERIGGHRRSVGLIHFAIMAGPLLLFLLNERIVQDIGVPLLPVDASILRADLHYLEAAGRNRFLAGCLFMAVIVLVSLSFFAIELCGRLTRGTRIKALAVFGLVQIPIWSGIIAHHRAAETAWRSYHQLGDGVMERVLGMGSVPICDDGDRLFGLWPCEPVPGVQLFRVLLDMLNALSGAGVAALVLGMILCLARPTGHASLAERTYLIGRAQLASRRFLYMAGLLLSSGMFVTMSWMLWPVPLVEEAHRAAFREVINGLLLYAGVFYTLLIVLGFGPVILIQARRIDALAMEALYGEGDPPKIPALEAWKKEAGLAVNELQSLQALLAAGAPLITGFAGSFVPL
ncbi:hypothetical protein [Poseidonocella pacifica]|uniref:hypothetical protein n=1 Tax=Poseidonocella pacifica TaxID=871651 RepID=UPI000B88B21C|nr:hypothetical protein [Poseidonocella pacifica]